MVASARIISVINDTFTVEFEIEDDDTDNLTKEMNKTDLGKKMLTLVNASLDKVKATLPENMLESIQAHDEALKEEGREEIYKMLKERGIDLKHLLELLGVEQKEASETPARVETQYDEEGNRIE